MARHATGASLLHLRTLFGVGVTSGLTDAQLLEQVATRRGEDAELAFAALVERHGPLVFRACLGILRNDHDALDAFQATFLILVRKRASLRVGSSLAPWLHRVACRAARRGRAIARCQRARERRAARPLSSESVNNADDDLEAILHEELDRLPDHYRTTVMLCDLEGHTCEETARLLGCPVGTVASRLARGRHRLRGRLTRRGLAPLIGVAGAGSLPEALGASVSPSLLNSVASSAGSLLAGRAAERPISPAVNALAAETLRTMLITRVIAGVAGLLVAGAIATGLGALARPDLRQRPPESPHDRHGPDVPPTIPVLRGEEDAQERTRQGRDGQGQAPTLRGKIVAFGESHPDLPNTFLIRAWDPDGGAIMTVADFPGHTWTGRVSRDGRRIAFMLPPFHISGDQGIHLWVMDADGRNREVLVENAGGTVCCWSPDGKRVIYRHQGVRNNQPAFQNFVVDLVEKKAVAITMLSNSEIVTDWSPDGEEWLTGTVGTPPARDPRQWQVYRINQRTTGRERIGDPDTGNSDARFSPDGRRIVFLTGAPAPTEGRRSQVRVMDRDGRRIRTVLEGAEGVGFTSPCWSPDGKRIAVISDTIPDKAIVPTERTFIIVDAEGKQAPRRLPLPDKNVATIDWP